MDFDDQPAQPAPPPYEQPGNAAAILTARRLAEEAKGRLTQPSKMWHMTDEHFVSVVEWLLAGISYKRIAELCSGELSLPAGKIPGRMSLSSFWQEFSPYWYTARRRANRQTIEQLNVEIAASPLNVDKALQDEIKQRAWELIQQPSIDPKVVKPFLNAVLKIRDQDQRDELTKLDREKFARETCELFLKWTSDAKARAIAESNVSNSEKIAQLRQLYFADIDALELSGEVQLP